MKTMRSLFAVLVLTSVTALKVSAQSAPLQIGPDKVKHFVFGALAAIPVQTITYKRTGNLRKSMLFGFGTGVIAGFVKELFDLNGHGTPSVKDFLWTGAGAGVASFSLRYAIEAKHHATSGL